MAHTKSHSWKCCLSGFTHWCKEEAGMGRGIVGCGIISRSPGLQQKSHGIWDVSKSKVLCLCPAQIDPDCLPLETQPSIWWGPTNYMTRSHAGACQPFQLSEHSASTGRRDGMCFQDNRLNITPWSQPRHCGATVLFSAQTCSDCRFRSQALRRASLTQQ